MLTDRTAFITGAASGIGLQIAKEMGEAGAKVVLSDKNREALSEAAEHLRADGLQVLAVKCDVLNEQEIQECLEAAEKAYGRIDILVNNAGMQHVAPIEEFPTETFEQMVRLMLVAPFMAIKHVFPVMKRQGFGRIINIASINGLIGFAGKAGYNSAKHGLIGLGKVAALEGAAHGITVNALCPGYVDTPLVRNQMKDLAKTREVPVEKVLEQVIFPLVPQKRLITVQEVAAYAVFLASEKAAGITGQAVVIDGGYTAQ
ncbi:3-hydroxybutyrate dehydrogenase [Brevibacillus massiliensis]|jgi:3-hydroxybutyrate dehydrogenase|uniref:3-hydroxybutyrate dehydrogenase n=1 Tax=Brevibacillus massiliensis TaxID=1118054 RepID=UPI00156359D7|nr:3-hydroxybutyrate dehydrogenase [Brevibacillus massiliensis]